MQPLASCSLLLFVFSFLDSLTSCLCVYTDYRNRVTIDGQTPMDYSIRLGREDLCDLLVRNGASPQLEPQIELAKKLKFTRIADKLRAFYGNPLSILLTSLFLLCTLLIVLLQRRTNGSRGLDFLKLVLNV